MQQIRSKFAGEDVAKVRDMLVTLNGFIHDLATGLWFGAVLLMSLFTARILDETAFLVFGREIMGQFQLYAWGSLAVMFLTGGLRSVFYRQYGFTGDIAAQRKRMLLVKHAILGVVVAVGVYLQIKLLIVWG